MTEQEWLVSSDFMSMLDFLQGKASERKLRLFAVASWKRSTIDHEQLRHILETSERYADGQASWNELASARKSGKRLVTDAMQGQIEGWGGGGIAYAAATAHPSAVIAAQNPCGPDAADWLRHIFGNPFHPFPAPDRWPVTVLQLADALYHGQDCGFALHDALIDAGHSNLAEHFRLEHCHPKGCWAVDLLLGKE